jgi:hypothetical protein
MSTFSIVFLLFKGYRTESIDWSQACSLVKTLSRETQKPNSELPLDTMPAMHEGPPLGLTSYRLHITSQ